MLRGRLPDDVAMYPDVTDGLNLRASLEDLKPTEAERMENMLYDGGLHKRFGSSRLNAASVGPFRGTGGIKFYYGTASKVRVIAYSTRISTISDTGAETILTAAIANDLATFMGPCSVTSTLYITDGTDALRSYA